LKPTAALLVKVARLSYVPIGSSQNTLLIYGLK